MNTQKIIQHITFWLLNYCETSKMNGFIIGISGGIDSALVSTLAAKTGKKTLVIEMPIHQKESEIIRAKEHIKWLKDKFPNVESQQVDLTNTFEELKKSLENSQENQNNILLSLANTRSRLRMTTLYYYAGIHNLLVTGTGNKIEDFGIGFFTKYGDGGVDISPIADLYKTNVYELAQELDIINSILEAVPTDGLWDEERTDETQIGATYPELEWAMENQKEKENNFSERQKKVMQIFKKLNNATSHKINPIPVCEIPSEFF